MPATPTHRRKVLLVSTKSLRPHTARRINLLLALTAIGAIAAAAGTATARADNITYLDTLTDNGLIVYDTSKAILIGHAICVDLNTQSGYTVAKHLYDLTSYADFPNIETAELVVAAAITELCPQHLRPGRLV